MFIKLFLKILRKRVFVFFIYFFIIVDAFSQSKIDSVNLHIESFGIKDGLSQGMVRGVIQDKEGFLWFATKDGLNKYDGYQITVYRYNPKDPHTLPDNYVTQIVEDDKANFWVGTSTKGLCLFDKKQEKFYPIKSIESKNLLQNNDIDYMQYQNGHLLIGRSSDIFIYDVSKVLPNNFSEQNLSKIRLTFTYNNFQKIEAFKYKYRSHISYNWMPDNSFWFCFKDRVFIAKPDNSLLNWKSDFFLLSDLNLPVNDNLVLFASPLKKAQQFLLTNNKWVVVYDAIKRTVENKVDINVNALYNSKPISDIRGNKLIDNGGLVFRYNVSTNTLEKVNTNSDVLKYGRFSSLIDKNDILWLGTPGYGLLMYDERKDLFKNEKGNFGHLVSNNANELLFSSISSRPSIYTAENKKFRNVFVESKWQKKWKEITNINIDKQGVYWLVAENSDEKETFASYNSLTNILKEYKNISVEKDKTKLIIIDNLDEIWLLIHTNQNKRKLLKIDRLDGNVVATYNFPILNDLSEYPFISQTHQDKSGIFWFATMQGLFSFNEQKNEWHQWKNDPRDAISLSADKLFSICPDFKEPNKYLWVGTNGGWLNKFEIETGKCVRYSDKDGLPNNVVYGLLNDEVGNLWLSTNKGLSCFSTETKSFRNFDETDGLFGDEFNRYESMKLQNGNLVFGGVGGFVIFNPKEILKKEPVPNIVFTNLSINNKPVTWKDDKSVMDAPIGYSEKIILQPGQQMFTIGFSSLEYRNKSKKLYKYYLEGYDKTWLGASNKNEATYTNLDPGTYTLHVTGTSSDGTWNQKGASIKIIKLPYWYQTWLFRGGMVLLIGGSIFALYRYRLKEALKMHTLRNNIASDLHDEIGSTLSSISLSSLIIQKKLKDDTNGVNPLLNQISKNTDNMMEAMSDIVWSINTKNDGFGNVINRMRGFAIEILEPKNCTVHFNIANSLKDIKLDMIQRKNIYLLFKEAINNIAKYAEAKNAWIDINLEKNHIIKMSIRDDGKGFSNEPAQKENLGGNGIFNMKKRADELYAKLSIETAFGSGTKIELECKL